MPGAQCMILKIADECIQAVAPLSIKTIYQSIFGFYESKTGNRG